MLSSRTHLPVCKIPEMNLSVVHDYLDALIVGMDELPQVGDPPNHVYTLSSMDRRQLVEVLHTLQGLLVPL